MFAMWSLRVIVSQDIVRVPRDASSHFAASVANWILGSEDVICATNLLIDSYIANYWLTFVDSNLNVNDFMQRLGEAILGVTVPTNYKARLSFSHSNIFPVVVNSLSWLFLSNNYLVSTPTTLYLVTQITFLDSVRIWI